MRNKKPILCVVGTRPEAIKMAPVIKALNNSAWAKCILVITAQHRELLDHILMTFGLIADYDLNLMQPNQSLGQIISRMIPEIECIIKKEKPSAVISQGDTATVFGAALAAFHCQIPFGHVEAGLRTDDLGHPFPEEGYRQMISRITRWHFAPTESAAKALRNEGIHKNKIYITGNTCIDTLLQTVNNLPPIAENENRIILLTAHRRENFGKPLESIFKAILELLKIFEDVIIIYPVHPNPNVQNLAYSMFSGHPRVQLKEPLDYCEFVDAMRHSTLIMTDSGGIQEEAPALGKPVLILRETTERPEPIELGVSELVGTNTKSIIDKTSELLTCTNTYQRMSRTVFPYGNGNASTAILNTLYEALKK